MEVLKGHEGFVDAAIVFSHSGFGGESGAGSKVSDVTKKGFRAMAQSQRDK